MSKEDANGLLNRVLLVSTLITTIFGGIAGAVTGTFQARAEVKSVATEVVREQWLTTLQAQTTTIAAAAARQAVSDAIRDAVLPIDASRREHEAMDNERQNRVDTEIMELRRTCQRTK